MASSGKGYLSNLQVGARVLIQTHNDTPRDWKIKIRRTYEMADRMEETMMKQKSLLIFLFDTEYGFDVAGGSPGRINRF